MLTAEKGELGFNALLPALALQFRQAVLRFRIAQAQVGHQLPACGHGR